MRAAYASEIALSTSPRALVERLNLLLCAGQLSAATVADISAAVGAMGSTTQAHRRYRVCAAVLMVMACAEYLIQK
jgi:uncharacterized membrane protein YdcZ (DUF606 family)